jgi:hypothetical protein
MAEKTLYIRNDLGDYADETVDLPDYMRSREDALEQVLPDEATVKVSPMKGYQGTVVIVVWLDGYIWTTHDRYGSCSGCDYFMGNPKKWTEQQLREFVCFENEENAHHYLHTTMDSHWNSVPDQPNGGKTLAEMASEIISGEGR